MALQTLLLSTSCEHPQHTGAHSFHHMLHSYTYGYGHGGCEQIAHEQETQGQVSISSHTKYHTFPDSGQSLQLAK